MKKNIIIFIPLLLIPLFSYSFKAVVICYHNIVENTKFSIDVSVKDFEKHIEFFKNMGYISVTASELVDIINSKDLKSNKKYVVITFDDGNDGVYKNAIPILKKYGFKATLYIYPSIIFARERGTRKSFMTWEQIKEVVNTPGFELGNHSYYHPYMTKEDEAGIVHNIINAARVLKEKTGQYPKTFAYPFGKYNEKVIQKLKEAKMPAFSIDIGLIKDKVDLYKIPRLMLYKWVNVSLLNEIVEKENLALLNNPKKAKNLYLSKKRENHKIL
ncbi:MAG TPA: polysaccharide deacetylase family protein [Spirochaetota bacterium]|nr:polysaccharide deacetylase family protein [Spirochaetota bacterium]HOM38793.1 polysaccharide deacetylase family protein [Spirochaetota bacterium]HPQ49851.1 polysaccharide deacetylase family protein [Spirochaetota bacterium]